MREVRGELPLLVCLAVLVALLCAVAAAGPGLLERLAGRALTSRLEQEQRAEPGFQLSARFEPLRSTGADAWASDLGEELLPVTDVIENAAPDALEGGLVHDSTRVQLPLINTVTAAGDVGLGLVYASDAPGRGTYAEGRPPDPDAEAVEIAVSTDTRDALKLRLGQELPLAPGALQDIDATAVVVGFFTADGGDAAGGSRLWREQPLLARPAQYPPHGASGLDWEARALVAPRTVTTLQTQADATLTVTWGMRLDLGARTAARFADDQGQRELQRLLTRYPDDARAVYCGDIDYGGMFCEIGPHTASTLQSGTRLPGVVTEFGRQWRQGRTVISFALASLIVVGLLAAVVTALLAVRRRLDAHRLQRARGASPAGLALARAAQTAPAVLLGLAAGLA
ncbi:hypothetical protein FE633_46755, partial [Streptomyces montanus]